VNLSFSKFESIYNQFDIIPIYETIKLPPNNSIDLISSLLSADPFVLLEGISKQVKHDQFTYLGLKPYVLFHDIDGTIYETFPSQSQSQTKTYHETIYDYIKNILNRYQRIPENTPPFSSGIMGMLSYESVKYLENISFNNPRHLNTPYSSFMIPQMILIMDNYTHDVTIVYSLFSESISPTHLKDAYQTACDSISDIKATIEATIETTLSQPTAAAFTPLPLISPYETMDYSCNMDNATFLSHVNQCKRYITEGDIFQVQISRRISIPFSGNPTHLYRHLRYHNPSPLMFYVHLNDTHLIGASPEILVNVDDQKMCIRPIAGTRKRYSKNRSEDDIINELLHDEKEIAEHIMLVDLARNDIGRACQKKSITVNELMYIEKYSHVIHMVSDVKGMLMPHYDAVDALKFGFPAGTVSGAPKIRAIEIIEELESEQREFYAGGIVFFDFKGNLKSALTIRTILVKNGISYTQAAGGIVADSIPEMELLETENKMKMCLSAMYQYGDQGEKR
jgi:anthranilate synthase component 1